ncbi:hypothetical protein D3C78_1858160 [compost metagenome]
MAYPARMERTSTINTVDKAMNMLFRKNSEKPTLFHDMMKLSKVAGAGQYSIGIFVISPSSFSDVFSVQ